MIFYGIFSGLNCSSDDLFSPQQPFFNFSTSHGTMTSVDGGSSAPAPPAPDVLHRRNRRVGRGGWLAGEAREERGGSDDKAGSGEIAIKVLKAGDAAEWTDISGAQLKKAKKGYEQLIAKRKKAEEAEKKKAEDKAKGDEEEKRGWRRARRSYSRRMRACRKLRR